MSDSFTNYNNVGNTKVSVSFKKLMPTDAHLARYFLLKYSNHSQCFNRGMLSRITQYNLSVECNNLNLESDQSEPVGHFFGKRHSPKMPVNFRDHSDSGLHHTILFAIIDIYEQSTIYSVHIVNTFLAYFAICLDIMLLYHSFSR